MHWFDVQEEYFEEYKKELDGFFKDPNGVIMDYDEVAESRIYNEPFYTEAEKDQIAPDGRVLHMKSQDAWLNVQKQLRSLKCTGVRVSFYTN